MRKATLRALVLCLALPGPACAQESSVSAAAAPADTVAVTGPTVVAFWLVPASDAVLEADPDLASALDEQQYWWSETRPLLDSAGIAAVDQPGRRFGIREPGREWTFAAHADSGATGYLFVAPGAAPRVAYGRRFPDEVMAIARDALPAGTGR